MLIRVGLATSIDEFFRRPFVEVDPEGLSPSTVKALEELKSLRDLRPFFEFLDFFNEKRRAGEFLNALGAIAADVVRSLVTMLLEGAHKELNALLTQRDPEKRGELVGGALGAGVVELVRMIAEPEAYSLIEMISELGIEPDEVGLLELPKDAVKP